MRLSLRQPAMIAALLLFPSLPAVRAAADPATTAPAQGQPAQGQPAQGQPGQGQPGQGQPAQVQPTQGQPAQAQPAQAQPAAGTAGPARPAAAPAPVPAPAPAAAPVPPFGFANVRQLAQQRAAHEYHSVSEALPASLANLSYDQYRDIRFRPASALWHGEALFEVQFFHRGYSNKEHINIFEVGPAGVTPVAYDPRFFTFGRLLKAPRAPATLGYAGFRVHYPLQTPHYKDELVAFLGASYFRVLGRNQTYGASARGLAIDTAEPGSEEFPTFTDFWLVRPQPNDRTLTVYALLDSKSVAGAYQFDIRPGDSTQVEVHCELFARRAINKLGVAPLTSMFFYNVADGGRRFDDYRQQVHDSDGLMAETGHGQWLWRPIGNPRELRVNRFIDESPQGFGLVQRDRAFADYQDVESHYESRPGYWVQPLGSWGKGGVELVEIPSDEEIHDNIVAYWVPAVSVAPGKPLSFAYLLSAFGESTRWPPGGRVVATRSGSPVMGDNRGHFAPGARRMLIDFAGGDLDGLRADQPVRAQLSADNGVVQALTVERLPASGAWRVTFVVAPKARRPVDLRCFLTLYGEVLTETWVYQWTS
jgi:glucans biosynthesis protein